MSKAKRPQQPTNGSERPKALPLDLERTVKEVSEALADIFKGADYDPLAWHPDEDPESDPEIRYRYIHHIHAEARENIREFAIALGKHRDLQTDLAQWHAVYQSLDNEWATPTRALGLPRRVASSPLGYQEHRAFVELRMLATVWLLRRYWRVIEDAYTTLDVPPVLFIEAIKKAFDNGWDAAVKQLDTVPTSTFLHYDKPIFIEVMRTVDDLRAVEQIWSGHLGPEPNIMLPAPQPWMTYDDYMAWIGKAIQREWDQIAPSVENRLYPGQRKEGRPKGGTYGRRVQLYEFWRDHPTRTPKRPDLQQKRPAATWERFAKEVIASGLFPDWDDDTSPRTIEDATKKVIQWGHQIPM